MILFAEISIEYIVYISVYDYASTDCRKIDAKVNYCGPESHYISTSYALRIEHAVVIVAFGANLALWAMFYTAMDFKVALLAIFILLVILVPEVFGAVVWIIQHFQLLVLVPVHNFFFVL